MLLYALIIFVLSLISLIYLDLPRRYRRWKLLRSIRLPRNLSYHWLLGHIPSVYKQDEALMRSGLQELSNPANKDFHIGAIWIGPMVTVHLNHSEALSELLKEPKSSIIYNVLKPWLGEGLLISEGDKWFRNRRLLTPAFHFNILKGYMSVYNSCLSVLLKKWSLSAMRKEPVKLFDTLSLISLDIIMQSSFSFKSNCQIADMKHPYASACCELVYLCSDRIMNPLNRFDWFFWLTPLGRKTKKVCKLVHDHAEKIITERKLALSINETEGISLEGRKYLDFLDILLTAEDTDRKGLTDLEIRNEVDTFMFEGHDTTTSGMSWTLYCLAQHPEHQDIVREEVRSILMGRDYLDYDDLKNLKYTLWCIKEAMRLYPPVFCFYRETTQDITLSNNLIPKDVIIAIEVFMIHRNPNIWENPSEFDPLRFHPENFSKHSPYDYIPFSAGQRNCIGQNFAINEMKVVIATIVNRFYLTVDETHPVEMVPRVILRTKYDIKIHLEPL